MTPRFIKAGLPEMAVILADSDRGIFENVAMQQLMEEENTKNAWETQFFMTKEEAHRWFLSSPNPN